MSSSLTELFQWTFERDIFRGKKVPRVFLHHQSENCAYKWETALEGELRPPDVIISISDIITLAGELTSLAGLGSTSGRTRTESALELASNLTSIYFIICLDIFRYTYIPVNRNDLKYAIQGRKPKATRGRTQMLNTYNILFDVT